MISKADLPLSWWGQYEFDYDQVKLWHIGPLTLIIRCVKGEWQIAHERNEEFDETNTSFEVKDTDRLPGALATISRYVFSESNRVIYLNPLLADRPVISRPQIPFYLAPGEDVTLYVSSPLWVSLEAGTSQTKQMEEIAIQQPSDTWFGPSTTVGEICYASSTHCRIDLAELPQRSHRAITPVLIRNQASTTLSLERLNVPTPLLALYSSADGQFWTPRITLVREKDGDLAALKIDSNPPDEAKQAVQLAKPRKKAGTSTLIQAFNAIFS